MAFLIPMFRSTFWISILVLFSVQVLASVPQGSVRVKDIARIKGIRDNSLIGYGIVTGLAGTGDSPRNQVAVQSISNALQKFGMMVNSSDIRSRNVAAVMITSTLPAFAETGDRIDVNVTSLGDARSLSGGTLLLADLRGPDQKIYALAQGPLSVGGYNFEKNGNVQQKNHPTSAIISGGATIEVPLDGGLVNEKGEFQLLLSDPDITSAMRLVDAINNHLGEQVAKALHPGKVDVSIPPGRSAEWMRVMMEVENLMVVPDTIARVVVNERTGTVVSGGDARINEVSITHGDLKISITNETRVYSDFFVLNASEKVVVPNSRITVEEDDALQLQAIKGSSVADLILALNQINASSREIITILQSLKRAGALHAELIIQ